MSVVPHRSDKPETQAAPPARQRAVNIATSMAERIAKLADKTATQTKSATSTAVEASKTGLARAAEIGRENVLPEIERTGSKLKERARPERLKQDYKNYLFWLHERVLDPPIETLFFKPTKEPVPLAGLTIRGNNREYGHDYRPTPCALFEWLVGAINYDLSRLTFVDYGAGKGRVLLLASQHPFHAVGGIEFAEELHDDAIDEHRAVPAQPHEMPQRRVRARRREPSSGRPTARRCTISSIRSRAEVFAEVLHNIVVSYRAAAAPALSHSRRAGGDRFDRA